MAFVPGGAEMVGVEVFDVVDQAEQEEIGGATFGAIERFEFAEQPLLVQESAVAAERGEDESASLLEVRLDLVSRQSPPGGLLDLADSFAGDAELSADL